MSSPSPDRVAKELTRYLDAVERVVEEVSDADIEARLRRVTSRAPRRERVPVSVSGAPAQLRVLAGQREEDPTAGFLTSTYRESGPALMAHVLLLTGNDREWAEDVVQETFVRAGRSADRLEREPEMLRAWLYTVARRLVIDGRRTREVRAEAPAAEHAAPEPVPRHLIDGLMRGLGEEDRTLLEDIYLRGRTVAEVAGASGLARDRQVAGASRAARSPPGAGDQR